jgi:hypothetical protein
MVLPLPSSWETEALQEATSTALESLQWAISVLFTL